MKRIPLFLTMLLTMTIGLGNSCDNDPDLMGSGAGVSGGSLNPNDPANFSPSGDPAESGQPGAQGQPNASTPGTEGGQTGVACESAGDCGSGTTCAAGRCELEAALIVAMTWRDNTDVDLHLVQPNGEEVYYRNRTTDAGARFSLDACIASRCEEGTERREAVRYEGWAPGGTYRLFATNFDGVTGASVTIEVIQNGQTQTFTANLSAEEGATSQEFTFDVEMTDAPCTVNVEGYGEVDLENDYIPNVVACENGDAPPEALKAAAIMARGFVYYKTKIEGARTLRNSEADQVYRCSYRPNGAGPEHYAAVRATTGVHPQWNGKVIAPFYVAGNVPPNPNAADPIVSCNGAGGRNGVGTEGHVTYNYGKFGCDIEMSSLGLVTRDCNQNPYNRGAASQNGQACLANFGWNATQMLEYYYGADIDMANADFCANPSAE